MRVPRRRPRAVYEVYDAGEALGEQDQVQAGVSADAAEPGTPSERAARCEQGALFDEDPGSPLPSQEHRESARSAGKPSAVWPRSSRRTRSAGLRALAGAMLCGAAVCAIAAISIALLHAMGGAGSTRTRSYRRGADASRTRSRGLHASRPAVARVSAAEPEPKPLVVSPSGSAAQGSSPRAAPPTPRRSPQVRALRRAPLIDAEARPQIYAADARSAALPALEEAPASNASGPSLPSAPGAIAGCACATAEIEFGFER